MRINKLLPLFLILGLASLQACIYSGKRIKGNGIITTLERSISRADKIKCRGNFSVLLQQGATASISLQSDENILPYITTRVNDEGYLILDTKDNVRLKPSGEIHVIVVTPTLNYLSVSGSGDVVGKDKFSASEKLELNLSGNGNMLLEVNTPQLKANITGNGNLSLTGETKDVNLSITGNGKFKGQELLSENAKVSVTGNGDAFVFASTNLDVSVTGSGDIFYKGSPNIKQRLTGNGSIQPIKE